MRKVHPVIYLFIPHKKMSVYWEAENRRIKMPFLKINLILKNLVQKFKFENQHTMEALMMGHTSFEIKSASRHTGLRQSFDQVLWYRWWCNILNARLSCFGVISSSAATETARVEFKRCLLRHKQNTKSAAEMSECFAWRGRTQARQGGGLGVNRQAFKLRKAANYQSETLSNITLMSRTLLGGGEWKGFPEVRSASRRRSAAFHSSHHSGPLRR